MRRYCCGDDEYFGKEICGGGHGGEEKENGPGAMECLDGANRLQRSHSKEERALDGGWEIDQTELF